MASKGVCAALATMVALLIAGPALARGASLDRSFGDGGTASYTTNSTNGQDYYEMAGQPHALTIDNLDRIIVGGGANNCLILLRYKENGELDPSFGENGVVRLGPEELGYREKPNLLYFMRRIETVDVSGDGSLFVTWTNYDGPVQYRLMHLFADGSVDASFGSKRGKHVGLHRVPYDAAILPGGRFVVGGRGDFSPNLGFVTELTANGEKNMKFGPRSSGSINYRSKSSKLSSTVRDIFPLESGKMLVSGTHNRRFFLARITARGMPDRGFGKRPRRQICRKRKGKAHRHACLKGLFGKVYTDFPDLAGRNCVYNQAAGVTPHGGIVQVGFSCQYHVGEPSDPLLMTKHHADGSVARNFGRNGKVVVPVRPLVTPRSVAIQRNGRILVALWKGFHPSSRFGLFRFLPNGKLDKSFFGNGKYVEKVGDAVSTADKVVIDSKGRAVVAGGAADFEPGTDDQIGGGSFVIKRFLLGK